MNCHWRWWRVNPHTADTVTEGDRKVCQCSRPEDAALMVESVNRMRAKALEIEVEKALPLPAGYWDQRIRMDLAADLVHATLEADVPPLTLLAWIRTGDCSLAGWRAFVKAQADKDRPVAPVVPWEKSVAELRGLIDTLLKAHNGLVDDVNELRRLRG